jgi:hypothetical protein
MHNHVLTHLLISAAAPAPAATVAAAGSQKEVLVEKGNHVPHNHVLATIFEPLLLLLLLVLAHRRRWWLRRASASCRM